MEVKKEPYEKPKLTVIELRADEVLAVGCKTIASGPFVGGGNCKDTPCVAPGS